MSSTNTQTNLNISRTVIPVPSCLSPKPSSCSSAFYTCGSTSWSFYSSFGCFGRSTTSNSWMCCGIDASLCCSATALFRDDRCDFSPVSILFINRLSISISFFSYSFAIFSALSNASLLSWRLWNLLFMSPYSLYRSCGFEAQLSYWNVLSLDNSSPLGSFFTYFFLLFIPSSSCFYWDNISVLDASACICLICSMVCGFGGGALISPCSYSSGCFSSISCSETFFSLNAIRGLALIIAGYSLDMLVFSAAGIFRLLIFSYLSSTAFFNYY